MTDLTPFAQRVFDEQYAETGDEFFAAPGRPAGDGGRTGARGRGGSRVKVRIVSLFALANSEGDGFAWEGSVDEAVLRELSPVTDLDNPLGKAQALYRYFNRVNQDDTERLESVGYRYPSLSVGDLLCWWEGETVRCYTVASIGFTETVPGIGALA